MSAAGGLENAVHAATEAGCTCVQLFSANQRQWTPRSPGEEQILAFRKSMDAGRLSPSVVHAGYLINLAATDKDNYRKSLQALEDELDRCEKLAIDYLVIHPGSHMGAGEEAGIQKIADSINRTLTSGWAGPAASLQPGLRR